MTGVQTCALPIFSGQKTEKKKAPSRAGIFRSSLQDATDAELTPAAANEPFIQAEATELLDAVHSAGDSLRKDATPENVRAYKAAVRSFVHYVVDRAYDVSEKTSGGNILKRKKFTTVVVIDEKLERLGAEVLSAQRDKLDILRRIDEIHGLLVDLLR